MNVSSSAAGITHGTWRWYAGEQHAVGEPVAATEGAVHARKQEPAEEQLLAEHGVEQEA